MHFKQLNPIFCFYLNTFPGNDIFSFHMDNFPVAAESMTLKKQFSAVR